MAARTKVFVDIITKTDGKEPGSGLKKFAIGAGVAAVALAGLVKVAKVWSKAASDAEEIGSKYATIFRDITKESEAMADKFAEDFGLASSTSRELLGNTADLLTGLGFTQQGALELSEQVNTLAADLASFSNFAGGTTGASEALTKALLGEAESVKALGIVINQNTKEYKDAIKFYTEVEGKTLLQAKAFTALQFATEQSGNAIGDVSRTWESHANVQRRLEESTKSFKEEMGKMVNEGVTPLLSVTDKLVSSLAEWLEKLNDTRDVLRELAEEGVSAEVSLDELQNTLEILNKRTEQLGRGGSQQLKDQIEAIESLIANYDHVHDRIQRNAGAEKIYTNILKERAIAAQSIEDIEIAARETLLELQFDALSSEAQQLQLLQEEIDKYSILRSQGADVQDLLNELVRQRNELLEEQIDLFEGLTPVADAWKEAELERIFAVSEAEQKAFEEFERIQKEKIALAQQFADLSLDFLSALDSLRSNSANAELMRMEDEGASQEELDAKKREIAHDEAERQKALALLSIGVNTAAAIVSALVSIPPNVPLSIAMGIVGAAQLAAAASVPIPSLATGGQFITDGPTMVGNNVVGDNASGQERVTVEPLGGGGDRGGSSRETFRLVGPGNELLGYIQRVGINNRGLHRSDGGKI